MSAILCLLPVVLPAAGTDELLAQSQYDMMQPYMNKTMRQKLKPSDSSAYTVKPNQAIAPRSGTARGVVARSATTSQSSGRRVVARSAVSSSTARSATTSGASSARSATTTASSRRVVSRSRSATNERAVVSQTSQAVAASQAALGTGNITSVQCLSNYTDCMDNYCHRPDAEYDRCYCSAKLAQIDAEYKPAINELLRKIIIAGQGGDPDAELDQDEINDAWSDIFSGSSSIADLNSALDIDWSGTESDVRGQNAFVAGDNYCKYQLRGCFYMAENMKSMYRTSIAQDCKAYETTLAKMKYVAEQTLSNY